MKYLEKIRKDVYRTTSAEASIELEAMGVVKLGHEYNKNEPAIKTAWLFAIKDSTIKDIIGELKRRLG